MFFDAILKFGGLIDVVRQWIDADNGTYSILVWYFTFDHEKYNVNAKWQNFASQPVWKSYAKHVQYHSEINERVQGSL